MAGVRKKKSKSAEELDSEAKKAAKKSGKLAIGSAGTLLGGAASMAAVQRVASSIGLRNIMNQIQVKDIHDGWEVFCMKSQIFNDTKMMEALGHVEDAIAIFGTAAVGALGLGAIGYGAYSAYNKIRSSLAKKKASSYSNDKELGRISNEVMDATLSGDQKKAEKLSKEMQSKLQHSDEETYADVLDAMSDEQKLAVLMIIDAMLKEKK